MRETMFHVKLIQFTIIRHMTQICKIMKMENGISCKLRKKIYDKDILTVLLL